MQFVPALVNALHQVLSVLAARENDYAPIGIFQPNDGTRTHCRA